MTSQFKVQGSLKGLVIVAVALLTSMAAIQAEAQATRGNASATRGGERRAPVSEREPGLSMGAKPCERTGNSKSITKC
jgi:hypothetical protein